MGIDNHHCYDYYYYYYYYYYHEIYNNFFYQYDLNLSQKMKCISHNMIVFRGFLLLFQPEIEVHVSVSQSLLSETQLNSRCGS